MTVLGSADDLKDLKVDMDSFYGDLHGEFETDEDYYDLDIAELLNLPKQFKKDGVVLPTAREVVDTATDHITPTFRRVTVPRRAATPEGTAQAQKLQRFYEALLNYFERSAPQSPFRDGTKHLATYGLSVWKLMYDQAKWPDEPKRAKFKSDEEYKEARDAWREAKELVMPFTLQVLNPREVMVDPFHDPAEWVIQTRQMYVMEAKSAYPNWPNELNRRGIHKVDVIEYWDNENRAVIIDGQPALKGGLIKHHWGVHPYIIGASGLGIDDSEHRPEKKYVGLLRYIRQVILSESRSYSIADIVMKAGAWPVRVAKGERAAEMPSLRMEYGTIQPLPPGVEIDTLTPDLPSEMVFSFMQVANSIISSATAPRVVRGLHQPGISSGFDRQLALGEARLRYGPMASAVENMLTTVCQKAGILMARIVPGQVSVASGTVQDEFVHVSGKDFKGHHAVYVKVNVLEPEDEIRKHQDGLQMVTGGVMSPQEFIRKYRPDVDPDTELGRILAARLLFSPQVMGLLSQGVVTKLAENIGLEEMLQQILEAAAGEAAGGVQAGRMAPSPRDGGAEPPVDGSRSDQARMRQLDLREEGR